MRQELARIPFARDFQVFSEFGKDLANLHVNYQEQPEYALAQIENPGEKLNMRVERMRLSRDKSALFYNEFLTLKGIPGEAYMQPCKVELMKWRRVTLST